MTIIHHYKEIPAETKKKQILAKSETIFFLQRNSFKFKLLQIFIGIPQKKKTFVLLILLRKEYFQIKTG